MIVKQLESEYIIMQYFLSHRFKQGDCDFDQIQVGEALGNGNSMVFSVSFQNKPAAMKEIVIKNQEQAKRVENEINMMKTLSRSDYAIIKYYGSFTTVRELDRYNMSEMAYIVMERAVMSLERLIQHRSRSQEMFNETQILSLMKVLINTLYVLQKQGIAHCDIKPQNILVMSLEPLEVKLCDIGSCRTTVQSTEQATLVGTVPFLAPELIKNYSKQKVVNNPYKSDVFSLGLCFIYLLLFKKFKSNDRLKIGCSIYQQIISEWVAEAKELYFKNEVISFLLDQLLNFNEKTRVNFIQLNDLFNKITLEYGMKNSRIIKQAKRKHQQIFVEKVKTPLRNTFYSVREVREEHKFGTTSEVFRKTNSFAIKLTSVMSTETPGTRKIRRKIVISKKQEERSTPNLSNINVAVSPLLSKRRKSIHPTVTIPANHILSSTTDESPKLVPKLVEKSDLVTDLQKHGTIYMNLEVLEQMKPFELDLAGKLLILDGCYNSLYDPKQMTLMANTEENLSNILMSLKEQQRLNSLVVDLRSFALKNEIPLQFFSHFTSINTLSLLLDNSQIPNFNTFLELWISINIKRLHISLKRSQIKPETVCEMISWINTSLELQFLNLNLQQLKLSEKENQSIIDLVSKFKSLKSLKINFLNNNISYSKQHPWQLPKTLQKLVLQYSYNNLRYVLNNLSISLSGIKNSLKELVLKLQDTALSSKQVNFLFNCLTKLQLETLCIKLGYNHLDDSVSKYVSKNFSLLQTITTLDIGLQSTNITPEGFISIITAADKMISKKLKFVTFSYNRYTDNETLTEQILSQINSESKGNIVFDNSIFRLYISMKTGVSHIKGGKKVGSRKSMIQTQCENYHLTGESFKHYLCLTCIQKNPIHKNIYLCEFCSESCDYHHHTMVPTFENVSCGCTYLKCKSDINKQLCSARQGYLIQKESKCLLCQKNNLCFSCSQSCRKNHPEMVVDNQNVGRFKCCQNKQVI